MIARMRASITRHMRELEEFSSWEAEAALILKSGEHFHSHMNDLTGERINRDDVFIVSNLAAAGQVTFGYLHDRKLICGRYIGARLERCWRADRPDQDVAVITDLWGAEASPEPDFLPGEFWFSVLPLAVAFALVFVLA